MNKINVDKSIDYINTLKQNEEQAKEIKELKIQLRIKDEYFHLIWEIGCDYDGYETPEGLKGVIDELVAYANCGANNDDEYVKELLGGEDKE